MIDLGKWAFGHAKLVYFLLAVLVAGGLRAAYDMSKLEDPEVKVKLAMVVATYPGASAHQVELEVTDPLEKAIRSMGGIDNLVSYSYNDLTLIQVELLTTTPDSEVEQAWDRLRRKVSDVRLPAGASAVVKEDFSLVYGMFYALTGDGLTERELTDYAELVRRELTDLEGVARVELYGRRDESIDIALEPERMATLGVSLAEILSTLEGQNKTLYAGYYDNGADRIRVAVADRFRTEEQIGALIVQGHEQDQLRLGDIARIEQGYESPVRQALLYEGARALGILVAAESGTDIVKVGAAVERRLHALQAERFPAGVDFHRVFYQPERVTDALKSFFLNLIESVAIVVAILMLSMGFRSGVIIGTSLATIVVGSFLLLGLFDGTMQRVSLASFILAMGMLVDNAIVIVDGILVDLDAGKPRREAMTAIGRKTALPLLGATLIAVLAFLPIYLSPDTAGIYIRDLFIVLLVSLLLSWVLALVHVPLMADHLLKGPRTPGAAAGYDGRAYRWLRSALRFALRHRIASVAAAVVLAAASAWGYRFMRQGFFPDMVYDQLYMEYKLPEGTNSTRVAADLAEISAYLHTRPEVRAVTASLGGTPARYNLVRSVANPSLSYGELIVDFHSPEELEANIDAIQCELTRRYPDAYVKLKRYNLMFKKYPIEAQFTGPDPAVLHRLADSARRIMERTPEVMLVTTDWEPEVPLLEVDYDQPAARRAGISRSNVSTSLLAATGGIPVSSFYDGVRKQTIYLKCRRSDGAPIDNLENVPVFPMIPSIAGLLDEETLLQLRSGSVDREALIGEALQSHPLATVSRGVDVRWESPVVPRFNGQRTQRVMCSPAPGFETEAARQAVAARIERLPLPAGFRLTWEGERGASTKTMRYLFKNFPLSIVLMIAVLILLFGDYRKPAVVLCCLPLLFVGVVGAMLLTGKTFTFCAVVGTLGLIGMMMKNCIVLMDEIDARIAAGEEPAEALVAGAESRLRPVMMASLTTILGMIPLLTDAMFGSMAATIMGGLLFSTFATLLFLPVLYALFFKIEWKR